VHARALEVPIGLEPICREAAVQTTPRITIKIHIVSETHDTQPVDVEVGVGSLERVECPVDEVETLGKNAVPLHPFEVLADSAGTILGEHRQHVGMMEDAVVSAGDHAADEADQGVLVESTYTDASVTVDGNQFDGGNRDVPNSNLQIDTLLIVGKSLDVSDLNLIHGGSSY
jgi:hypothetical protein